MELNRRTFIKTAGSAVAATAVAGMASAALADEPPAADAAPAQAEEAADEPVADWHEPPAEVTEFAQEIDCDVVVCGHGFAGITCCRELAEEGANVYLIEKQEEESFAAVGNESASLKSDLL